MKKRRFPIKFPMLFNGKSTFFHFLSNFHTFQWEFCFFPLFFNFPCYSIEILHFFHFSSIFHTIQWEFYICFIFLSIFHGVQRGLHILHAIQWKFLHFFFINFPCFSMETIEIFISCQFSMLFNDEMVLSNPIEQKSLCVLQDIILLGTAALLTITYIHIHTK